MATDKVEAVKALGKWAKPTLERYQQHLDACCKYDMPPELLEKFVDEVTNTPPENRDWLLETPQWLATLPPPTIPGPVARYRQYDTPIATEMSVGWGGRQRK